MIVSPLHVWEREDGTRLRYFRSPLEGADFPWHAIDDMRRCLGIDEREGYSLLQRMRSEWGSCTHTVGTDEGIVVIAPHFAAQGLLDVFVEAGLAPESLRDGYHTHGMRAIRVVTEGMSPVMRRNYMLAAMARHHQDEGVTG